MGGVAVGVMVLIVVLAVMSGFETSLKEKILGMNSHIWVLPQHRVVWKPIKTSSPRIRPCRM